MTDQVFDPGAIESIDQASVETSGPQFPAIQWHYGSNKSIAKKVGGMDYQGGWFLPEDSIDAELLGEGWEQVTWEHTNGTAVDGFYRREIAVSVVAARQRWEVYNDNGAAQVFAWNEYDAAKANGRPSSRTHVLCLVKGMEDIGAMVLTLKGSAAMSFSGTRSQAGALTMFANTVIKAANQASDEAAKAKSERGGKRWPYRAFWLPVGAERDAKGAPVFTEMGSGNSKINLVLPVALGLPSKADAVDLGKFYIGADLLPAVNELWAEAEEGWTHAWDSFADSERTVGGGDAAATPEEEEPDTVAAEAMASLGL